MKIYQVDTYFTTILISYFYNKQHFKCTYMTTYYIIDTINSHRKKNAEARNSSIAI